MRISSILLVIINGLLNYITFSDTRQCYNHAIGFNTELCIRLIQNNENRILTPNKTISFHQGDDFSLICKRPKKHTSEESATLRWKLQQGERELLVTTAEDIKTAYKVNITLDSYDDHLNATCEANSNLTNDSISIIFNLKRKYRPKQDVFIEKEKKEGELVLNTENRTVFVYTNGSKEVKAEVKPGGYITHNPLLLKDNGTVVYTAWFKKEDFIIKRKWKIIVLPQDSSSKQVLEFESKKFYHSNSFPDTYKPVKVVPKSGKSIFLTVAVVTGIVGLLVVLLIITFTYFKYFKRTETSEDIYAQTYSNPAHVVYAQIDLKASNGPVPNRAAEPYAQIIGVMMPKKKPITKTRVP